MDGFETKIRKRCLQALNHSASPRAADSSTVADLQQWACGWRAEPEQVASLASLRHSRSARLRGESGRPEMALFRKSAEPSSTPVQLLTALSTPIQPSMAPSEAIWKSRSARMYGR